MKVLLAFPPYWYSFEPPLGIAKLSGFLKAQGIDVGLCDLNIQYQNYILSKEYLLETWADLKSRGKQDADISEELIDKIVESKDLIKLEDIAVEEYITALQWISKGFEFVSRRFTPTKITLEALNFEGNLNNTFLIHSQLGDIETNPFISFFKKMIPKLIKEIDIFGISIIGKNQLLPGLTLAKLIKEVYSDIHISIGGNIFSNLHDRYQQWKSLFSYFDSIVVNSGEIPFYQLIQHIEEEKDFFNIPNLIYKAKNGNIKKTYQETKFIVDASVPDFDGIPFDDYFVPGRVIPFALISTKCYWGKCAFCVHDFCYNVERKTIENIVEEIILLKEKHQVDSFDLIVENGLPPWFIEKFAKVLLDKDVNIKWRTHYRLEKRIDFEMLQKSGCVALYSGIESGSDKILQKMNKGVTIKQYVKNLRHIFEAGIWVRTSLFFGFPGERIEDAIQTIKFIIDNKKHISSSGWGTFQLFKGSKVWHTPEEYNILIHKELGDALRVEYQYEVKEGLTPAQADKVNNQYLKILAEKFPDFVIWSQLPGAVLFKILTRYLNAFEAKEDFYQIADKIANIESEEVIKDD